MLGGENSLLLIDEDILNKKRPKIDEKHEIVDELKEKCQSLNFMQNKSERDKLIEKLENLVPPKTRKIHNTAKFCCFS